MDLEAEVTIGGLQSFEDYCESANLVYQQYLSENLIDKNNSALHISPLDFLPGTQIFIARLEEKIVGTGTAVQNSLAGLPSDEIFRDEFSKSLLLGKKICEGTKFASTDPGFNIPCKLISAVFAWCRLMHIDEFFNVANKRHSLFWNRALDFEIKSSNVKCPRVNNAPGQLLKLNLREIFLNEKKLTPSANRIYIEELPENLNLRKKFKFTDLDIALLMLQEDALQNESNLKQLDALRTHFPTAFKYPLYTNSEESRTLSPQKFNLFKLVEKVLILLKYSAKQKNLVVDFEFDEGLPKEVIFYPYRLAQILSLAAKSVVKISSKNASLQFKIEIGSWTEDDLELKIILSSNDTVQLGQLETYKEKELKPKLRLIGGELLPHKQGIELSLETLALKPKVSIKDLSSTTDCPLEIIVINESSIDQNIFRRILEQDGHSVSFVKDQREALQEIEEKEFGLLLMDKKSKLDRSLIKENTKIPTIALTEFCKITSFKIGEIIQAQKKATGSSRQ